MSDAEVTIEKFAADEAERLKRFIAEWRENAAKEPQDWPEKLPLGEWDEQYRLWSDEV